MKKLIASILFLFLLVPNIGLSMKLTEIKNISDMDIPKVDTSKWITHPVGRYLIKLPPLTQIEGQRDLEYNDSSLTWEKGLTIQEANSLLKSKYIDLVKKEWLNVEYTENFGPEGLGSLLASSYKKDPDTGASSIFYEMYVVNNKPAFDPDFEQRVYSFKFHTTGESESDLPISPEKILNSQKKETDFIHMLANNIWPSDKALPLETRNGVYFEGGFVHTPSDFHKLFYDFSREMSWDVNEETSIECTFYEYPHIEVSLSSRFSFDGSPATEIKTEAENKSDANIPDMYMDMASKNIVLYVNKESFFGPEDEAAIAFWNAIGNAITENIRWRPDNWKVKAPDGPYFMVYEEIIPAIIPQ